MLNNDLSEAMKKEVERVQSKISKQSTVSNITMTFSSPLFQDKTVYICREIQSLKIHQDFVGNITDKITAELQMEMATYLALLYMRKNLICKLEITFVKPDEVIDDHQYKRTPDYSKTYKCVLTKYEDLFKKFSSEQLLPKNRATNASDIKIFNMSIELIAEDVYKARKQQMYLTARDVSMLSILRYTVNYFGFNQAHIHKPDNMRLYTNFVIPPAKGVEEIMGFLQNSASYGIYNDGLVSYIMNGVWYVYPRYGEPLHRHAIHVYCLGGNKYAGLPRMDYVEDTLLRGPTTFIISPSELEETNWTNLGSENEPTSIVSMLSDLVVDGTRHLINDTRVDLNSITYQSTIVPPDTMDFDNYIRIKHMQSPGNLFAINSRLRAQQGSSLKFSWEGARPWVFHPATIVSVHYDDHNKVGTAEGICEVADYVFTKDPRARMVPLWTCKGEFDVYCSVRDSGLGKLLP